MAALDELNAQLGMVASQLSPKDAMPQIKKYTNIQKNIMTAMSLISTTSRKRPTSQHSTGWDDYFHDKTMALEAEIDTTMAMIPTISTFVTYGQSPLSASLDLARAVARRAETQLSQAAETSGYTQSIFPYINRLSDYLYAQARYADFEHRITKAVEETLGKVPPPGLDTLDNPINANVDDLVKTGKVTPPSADISPTLNLDHAKTILVKIEQESQKQGLKVVIAIANATGNPIAVQAMDGALLVSYEAATAKAYTAAALKMPTIELSKLVQPGQPFYGLETIANGKILPIGGGIPLFNQGGQLIGAIGVSGGTASQDHALAAAAAQVYRPMRS